MNKKSYSFDMETFRNMLLICPKLPRQKFVDPPFEEEILTFIRELGYPGNIKLLSDVKVDTLPQPWRTFGIIINKCLSGKEDLVFQIENKESRKNKYMFYPRFTKVIINHFMSQDQSIPRRNKVDWHMANDDPILTTMRFIPQHEVVQRYGAILPDYLTNPAMKESEAYKTYYDLATGKVQPKLKYVRRSSRTKTDEAPKPSSGKRVKATAKVAKSGKKKQPALGLETLSDIALTEAEQMKLAIERSKTQLHISQPSGSGAHEGTGVTPGVPDVPTYESDDEQISWKSSEEEDDDEENMSEHEDDDEDERTESDNDGDDFVHPKFSTHDDEAKQDEEINEEDSFDPRVQTPSHVESTDDEDSDDEIQDANVEGDMINEENTHEEVKANVLYRDMNVNLEGRDIVMTDALLPNVQETQETEDTHVILTAPINPEGQQQSSSVSSGFISNMLNPRPDTCIDSIFNLNTEVTSLVDVLITIIAEPPLVFATTLLPPPFLSSRICNKHQFPHQQLFQAPPSVSSIPGIVDAYLANKMHDAVKTVVRLQSNKLRDEALAENEAFLNSLDDNIKKIIKDQVKQQVKAQVSKILPRIEKTVNEQLEAEVMTCSSTKSKTSHVIAANLSELELKKILIHKMESNKSIHISDEQKNLYKALVEAYESDKLILDTYGDIVSFKRCRDDEDKDEEPLLDQTGGPREDELEKNQIKLPTPDRDWNKTLPAVHGPVQPWLSNLAQEKGPHESFDELMDTPLDFSAFMMNRLKIDTLTPELLGSPTFELMKGTCKSLVELEYLFKEVYIGTTDQLDGHNPEGQQYPHDLRKPLPLIPNSRGRQVIPFDHFINNDLVESARDVYSKRRIIAVTKLQIVKWHSYKHLDWITVRRDDDKLYTFKEGNFKWLRLQDIKDMLILLVQGKLTNLNVEDRIESYQKKLNITNPDTYRFDLKRKDAYIAYSNPRGFIYQNKDKKNKLMRIDELHKFSNGTLDDVRTALNDHLKGIRIEYLLKTIWRQSDRERAKAMIQAIDKQLKSIRIKRSLEKFVSGRPYEGDLRLLQRTI
ncbi:hypothetical protein Tco_0631764 [Tanacetum coccineum]